MNVEYIAPLIISQCIQYFDKKSPGTTYHPDDDIFILDAKIAARIIKHGGRLNASVSPAEKCFFDDILRYINRLGLRLFESTLTGHTFIVSEHTAFPRFAMRFERRRIIKHRGRKPKYIEVSKWQTQQSD